uniref:Zf-C3HC4 domain-containing protein n=1 Tax=Anisakis simplex TaxID=6269 RepID=A0A0M3JIZ9_ANISI
LMKKIIQKQEDSQRRYEQTLKQVKQRAVELSSPRPFETITTLADFTQLPSEIEYIHYCVGDNVITYCGNDKTNSNDDNNNVNNSNTSVMKKCNLCNVEVRIVYCMYIGKI